MTNIMNPQDSEHLEF